MVKRNLETSMMKKCDYGTTISHNSLAAIYAEAISPLRMRPRECLWIVAFLLFLSGCFYIPVPSKSTFENRLQKTLPVDQGDVVVVYGENAKAPMQNAMKDYFTAGCMATFETDTVGNLIKAILEENPLPGRFAVRHLTDLQTEAASDPSATDSDSILSRLNLSKTKVLADRLRYAIHVEENFEVTVHIPLYVPPFGTATCRNKTVIKADVWELPTEKFIGSLTVSAEGEYVVAAYIVHLIVFPETQKDATRKLAREIVELLTGSKQSQDQNP